MKRIIAVLVLIFAGLFVTATPAEAGECTLGIVCGSLHHYNGAWDQKVLVRCQYGDPGSNRYVAVDHNDPCKDMDQVYVYSGAELWCRTADKDGYFYWKEFDATGWHKTNDLWHHSCTYRHD